MANLSIVFGATGGIGRELCKGLRARGDRVLAVARNPSKLQNLASELQTETHVLENFSDSAHMEKVFQSFEKQFGPPSTVVNCIGNMTLKPAHALSDQDFDEALQVNLRTSFAILKGGLSVFRNQATEAPKNFVFCSAVAASLGIMNHEAIAAAKAGLEGLVRAAAATYAPKNIRINAVAPGLVNTPLTERITHSEMNLKASIEWHPLKRIGQPKDVVSAILWLSSPEQEWVTGQVLHVDGGLGRVKAI